MYFSNINYCFQLLCNVRVGIDRLISKLFVACFGTHLLRADDEVHARVAYGSSYLPLRDVVWLLGSVPHRTRHTRLGIHH